MSNGNVTSQPATPVTDSPPDVLPPSVQEQVAKRAQELAEVVLGQQAPPGTPKVQKP